MTDVNRTRKQRPTSISGAMHVCTHMLKTPNTTFFKLIFAMTQKKRHHKNNMSEISYVHLYEHGNAYLLFKCFLGWHVYNVSRRREKFM